jgi:hypothetical protein
MRPLIRDLVIDSPIKAKHEVLKRICTAGNAMFIPQNGVWESFAFSTQRNQTKEDADYFRCHFPVGLSTNVKLQVLAKAMSDLLVADPDLMRADCAGVLAEVQS